MSCRDWKSKAGLIVRVVLWAVRRSERKRNLKKGACVAEPSVDLRPELASTALWGDRVVYARHVEATRIVVKRPRNSPDRHSDSPQLGSSRGLESSLSSALLRLWRLGVFRNKPPSGYLARTRHKRGKLLRPPGGQPEQACPLGKSNQLFTHAHRESLRYRHHARLWSLFPLWARMRWRLKH